MASVAEPRVPRLLLRLPRLLLHLPRLLLRLPHQIPRMTGVAISMDSGRLHPTSLIKDNAVPQGGRLGLRDARRNALVRQNVAVVRPVWNVRSLTSFSFKLSSEIDDSE